MPYTARDATRFTRKARSPKRKKQWSKVYKSARARGASEGSAIAQASGVVRDSKKGGRVMEQANRRGRGRKKHRK